MSKHSKKVLQIILACPPPQTGNGRLETTYFKKGLPSGEPLNWDFCADYAQFSIEIWLFDTQNTFHLILRDPQNVTLLHTWGQSDKTHYQSVQGWKIVIIVRKIITIIIAMIFLTIMNFNGFTVKKKGHFCDFPNFVNNQITWKEQWERQNRGRSKRERKGKNFSQSCVTG